MRRPERPRSAQLGYTTSSRTPPRPAESLADAGISSKVVAAVVALTRTTQVADDDYYRHIREVPVALLVKTADIAHNRQPDRVAKLDDETRERLKLRYDHALEVLGVDPTVITALHKQGPWAATPRTADVERSQ